MKEKYIWKDEEFQLVTKVHLLNREKSEVGRPKTEDGSQKNFECRITNIE